MSVELIRLDGYMPVRIAGVVGLCQELGLDRIAVDLPPDMKMEGELGIELLLSDRLAVQARAVPRSQQARGVSVRHVLDVVAYEADGRARLTGHISALRKTAHLNIVANEDVESATVRAGWDRWRFRHDALPELNAAAIALTTELLGKTLAGPLLIAGMTGGSERAGTVNRRLAQVAQELGLGMGLGSQRAMLEAPDLSPTFQVRDLAPDILLLANVGAVQLNYGVSVDDVRRMVDAVQADALAVHLNVLQEMVQPEGDRDWSGLRSKLGGLIEAMHVPVIVKETGCGIGPETAVALRDLGAAAIDVGGTGGTSWGWIEGFRAADPQRQQLGATFRDWGLPTADAVVAARAALGPDFPVISTGGVRSGLDVAKALALGANAAGMALPFFRAADVSLDEALALGQRILDELRIAAMCSGASDLSALSSRLVSS
jgi:isopentenyl-diphosphate Delta-isomerase